MMSDYRFQIVEHNGIPCLHVMINGDGETYIPVEDIQDAIERLEVAPGLIEFPEEEEAWEARFDGHPPSMQEARKMYEI